MEGSVEFKTSERRHLICVDAKGPYQKVVGPTIQKLMQHVMPRGLSPGGVVVGIYRDSPEDTAPEDMRCTIAVPASEGAEGEGEFYVMDIEPRDEAVYMHRGPYDDLGSVYGGIIQDIFSSGRRIAGPFMELYHTDPQSTPPEEWMTEIRVPVSGP